MYAMCNGNLNTTRKKNHLIFYKTKTIDCKRWKIQNCISFRQSLSIINCFNTIACCSLWKSFRWRKSKKNTKKKKRLILLFICFRFKIKTLFKCPLEPWISALVDEEYVDKQIELLKADTIAFKQTLSFDWNFDGFFFFHTLSQV